MICLQPRGDPGVIYDHAEHPPKDDVPLSRAGAAGVAPADVGGRALEHLDPTDQVGGFNLIPLAVGLVIAQVMPMTGTSWGD